MDIEKIKEREEELELLKYWSEELVDDDNLRHFFEGRISLKEYLKLVGEEE